MIEFRIDDAGLSETGPVRLANEDAMVLRAEQGLWAVADGMGGHANGKWASEQIAVALSLAPLGGEFESDVSAIGDAISEANRRIVSAAEQAGTVIGSTVAILFLAGVRFVVLWAGDSRIYLSRNAKMIQLTRDHTYVQDMLDAGTLSIEGAKSHAERHVLSRAVGAGPAIELEAVTDVAEPLDVFLLCSDGLTGMVSDAEIGASLARFPPHTAAQQLLDLAISRGAPDNVTIVVVSCIEKTKINSTDQEACDV